MSDVASIEKLAGEVKEQADATEQLRQAVKGTAEVLRKLVEELRVLKLERLQDRKAELEFVRALHERLIEKRGRFVEVAKRHSRWIGVVLLILSIAGLFWTLTVVISVVLSRDLPWPRQDFRSTVTSAIFLTGSLFYQLRSRLRAIYGLIEVAVGIGAAWIATGQAGQGNRLVFGAALISAVYVIVRGLDNFFTAYFAPIEESERDSHLAKAMLERIQHLGKHDES
jgi:hypothetical protein